MALREAEFPTIRDLRDRLSELIEQGLGGQPVQVVVVPDSTIQALARSAGSGDGKPALMVELPGDQGRLPVALISTERFGHGNAMPSIRPQ
jgi:hypothetical protein